MWSKLLNCCRNTWCSKIKQPLHLPHRSKDDPFLLYAALNSGNHCRFVSRDLMRDHKACLPDGARKRLFFKWQRGHQLVVDSYSAAGRKVCFQVKLKTTISKKREEGSLGKAVDVFCLFQGIPSYDTIIQTSSGSWHVPFDDSQDRSTYEVPQKWLCLRNQHKHALS